MDEQTLDILSEESIQVYLAYYDKLKSLFTAYYHPNFNAAKKVRFFHSRLCTGVRSRRRTTPWWPGAS